MGPARIPDDHLSARGGPTAHFGKQTPFAGVVCPPAPASGMHRTVFRPLEVMVHVDGRPAPARHRAPAPRGPTRSRGRARPVRPPSPGARRPGRERFHGHAGGSRTYATLHPAHAPSRSRM
ncbi:hypothetical protein ACE1SV_61650 [Streptomyces sp. E-15]